MLKGLATPSVSSSPSTFITEPIRKAHLCHLRVSVSSPRNTRAGHRRSFLQQRHPAGQSP